MLTHQESQIMSCSADNMRQVIWDINAYPEFIYGCQSTHVMNATDCEQTVSQTYRFGLIQFTFHSTAKLIEPNVIQIHSQDGPFQSLDIHWIIKALDEQQCQVKLNIEADVQHVVVNQLLQPFAAVGSSVILHWFEQRARQQC